MRYEILLRNKFHDITIIPYAVVSHIGVDTLLSRVCEADESDRAIFFGRLAVDKRARYMSDHTPFILAVVTVEKGNAPLSLSPNDFFDYEDQEIVPMVCEIDEEDEVQTLSPMPTW